MTKISIKQMILLSSLLILLCIALLSAQSNKRIWLVDAPILNMRSAPHSTSPVVLLLHLNDRLEEIIQQNSSSSNSETIDGLEDDWIQVVFNAHSGWVFRGYLRPFEFQNRTYISASKALRCCLLICRHTFGQNADCGETCYGDGQIALLRHGWTPTAEEWVSFGHYRPFAAPFPAACQ